MDDHVRDEEIAKQAITTARQTLNSALEMLENKTKELQDAEIQNKIFYDGHLQKRIAFEMNIPTLIMKNHPEKSLSPFHPT